MVCRSPCVGVVVGAVACLLGPALIRWHRRGITVSLVTVVVWWLVHLIVGVIVACVTLKRLT